MASSNHPPQRLHNIRTQSIRVAIIGILGSTLAMSGCYTSDYYGDHQTGSYSGTGSGSAFRSSNNESADLIVGSVLFGLIAIPLILKGIDELLHRSW